MKPAGSIRIAAGVAVVAMVVGWPATGAEPGVTLTPRENWSTFFGGRDLKLRFVIRSAQRVDGRLLWSHSADQRTIARGESVVKVNDNGEAEAEISLRLPEVREGVIFDTQLRVQIVDRRGELIGRHDRTLRLFPTDAFADRRRWLADLGIVLYDPEERTEKTCKEQEIPYRLMGTVSALSRTTEGVVIIGEDVSLRDHPGLPEVLMRLSAAGVPVLCLAPADGDFPFPGTGEDQPKPRRVVLCHGEIIRELDKRLDADAWPPEGQVAAAGLQLTGSNRRVLLSVDRSPPGWPWLEVVYPGGGRLIVCGFGVVRHWDASPTPRWLLLRILERLSQSKNGSSISFEKE